MCNKYCNNHEHICSLILKSNKMKKAERKVLRGKLLTAVKKVLKDNKDELKNKTVKAINKSIKQIARKTDKITKVIAKK